MLTCRAITWVLMAISGSFYSQSRITPRNWVIFGHFGSFRQSIAKIRNETWPQDLEIIFSRTYKFFESQLADLAGFARLASYRRLSFCMSSLCMEHIKSLWAVALLTNVRQVISFAQGFEYSFTVFLVHCHAPRDSDWNFRRCWWVALSRLKAKFWLSGGIDFFILEPTLSGSCFPSHRPCFFCSLFPHSDAAAKRTW